MLTLIIFLAKTPVSSDVENPSMNSAAASQTPASSPPHSTMPTTPTMVTTPPFITSPTMATTSTKPTTPSLSRPNLANLRSLYTKQTEETNRTQPPNGSITIPDSPPTQTLFLQPSSIFGQNRTDHPITLPDSPTPQPSLFQSPSSTKKRALPSDLFPTQENNKRLKTSAWTTWAAAEGAKLGLGEDETANDY